MGCCGDTLRDRVGRADLHGEFLGEQAAAPEVGRAGTGVDGGLQLTRQLVASGGKAKVIKN